MFGIGIGEFLIIGVVLLIAVGPDKLPTLVKSIVKGVRTFRRTARELQSSIGLDEILQDEDLQQLRRPLSSTTYQPQSKPAPSRYTYELTRSDFRKEHPASGPDLVYVKEYPVASTPSPPIGHHDEYNREHDSHVIEETDPVPVSKSDAINTEDSVSTSDLVKASDSISASAPVSGGTSKKTGTDR